MTNSRGSHCGLQLHYYLFVGGDGDSQAASRPYLRLSPALELVMVLLRQDIPM